MRKASDIKEIKLGSRVINNQTAPFIIAEMSGNHNNSLERALEIVDAAAESGVDALKIQTYTADSMTLDINTNEFMISEKSSLWYGKSLYELYQKASTPYEWHMPIKKRCEEKGIEFFSSPFDAKAVDFLEELNVPFYKIASFENIDIPLIKRVAQTGKPIIISTGMATVTELELAVTTARDNGCEDLILLKCTSSYPAPYEQINLRTMEHLGELFSVRVGLSDHTLGVAVPIAATTLGASVIEKHFTLDRNDGGVDSAFSLTPDEFSQLVCETKNAWSCLGKISYGLTKNEKLSHTHRRSIYIAEDVKKGEAFSKENIRVIRPGLGLAPKYYEEILDKKADRDLNKGTALCWDHVAKST